MAVLAGVVAQVAADKLGDIGPFQVRPPACLPACYGTRSRAIPSFHLWSLSSRVKT